LFVAFSGGFGQGIKRNAIKDFKKQNMPNTFYKTTEGKYIYIDRLYMQVYIHIFPVVSSVFIVAFVGVS
jgi:hypothetical protein